MSQRLHKVHPLAFECQGCDSFECTDNWTLEGISIDKERALPWLKSHGLVWSKVTCALASKHEEDVVCILKRNRSASNATYLSWVCPSCHAQYFEHGPLLTKDGQKSPSQVISLIYYFVSTIPPLFIQKETLFTYVTIRSFRKKIDRMVSWAHQLRFNNAEATAKWLQKDETFFSHVKRGGCHKAKRVRAGGVTKIHTLVITNAMQTAKEVFMLPVMDLKASTLNPHVRHLCKDANTRVRTDGAKSNYDLGGDFIWEPCDHKWHWVAPEGHSLAGNHTQTVESMHSHVKKNLQKMGGYLGKNDLDRSQRIQFLAEVVNGSLVFCHSTKLRRIFQDLRMYAQVCFVEDNDEA